MGKLIADSGSTKTSWLLTDGPAGAQSFQTPGINPFFRSEESIYKELKEKLLPEIQATVNEIFFYGSGIVNDEKAMVINQALRRLFPDALTEAHSDVFGAARALFGIKPGIACIMGTGSNTCLYDGETVVSAVPPLGFILGDEGSGAVLGKKLLSDYFKTVMPTDVQSLFEKEFMLTEADVLEKVYRTEHPNRYLAGFAPFLSENISEPYCRELVTKSLGEFFERNVLRLPDALEFSIGFAGSVAFAFRALIEELAEKYGFTKPVILKNPITGLKEFHAGK